MHGERNVKSLYLSWTLLCSSSGSIPQTGDAGYTDNTKTRDISPINMYTNLPTALCEAQKVFFRNKCIS